MLDTDHDGEIFIVKRIYTASRQGRPDQDSLLAQDCNYLWIDPQAPSKGSRRTSSTEVYKSLSNLSGFGAPGAVVQALGSTI